MATSAATSRSGTVAAAVTGALYGLGALLLAVEAAVHVQQFVVIFHAVRWIGPLFIANAAACVIAIAGLATTRTRAPAAFAGIAISTAALGGLVLSYGVGLFGWMEGGFRTPIAIALASEVGATLALGAALCATKLRLQVRTEDSEWDHRA